MTVTKTIQRHKVNINICDKTKDRIAQTNYVTTSILMPKVYEQAAHNALALLDSSLDPSDKQEAEVTIKIRRLQSGVEVS